jgi:hypothetical protein
MSPFDAKCRSLHPLKDSELRAVSTGRIRPRVHIELHDAVAIVGDKDASVGTDLQAVGPAVIFCYQRPFAVRRDLEDASERDVDDAEIAVGIE